MGLCTAFVFAALVEFTIVNFWFRKHRKRKENALALMLPFVSTASNLTAATQMSAATKTENTMRANQKKVKTSFKKFLYLYLDTFFRRVSVSRYFSKVSWTGLQSTKYTYSIVNQGQKEINEWSQTKWCSQDLDDQKFKFSIRFKRTKTNGPICNPSTK